MFAPTLLQTARSGSRKCAERNAQEKGKDALPLTFVSSWSTMLAADFDDVSPHDHRSHPRPLPQMMPQAPTMFAAASRRRQRPPPQEMPQQPTTGQRRAAERSPTTPKLSRKRPAFRGGLLASSGACANLCCHVLRTGVAGQVSCFCALRVRAAPSRLIAPKRPPINRRGIPRRVAIRLPWPGRTFFFWIETRNALVSVLAFKLK